MDRWQHDLYKKCSNLVGRGEGEVTISSKEAYVIMKALEDQQMFRSPRFEVPEDAIGLR